VGSLVAARCLAFGMTVLAYDPYVAEEQRQDERISLVSLREVLTRSDFITIHVPSTHETKQLLNTANIALMKKGARVINTSYGGVLDEQALADAIKQEHLSGAALDVFNAEPPYNSPLIGLDNVIHTPHIGDNTIEAAQDLSLQIAQQVVDALKGDDYRNIINLPFVPGLEFETIRPYMQLAERIGTLHHVLARHPIKQVAVEYSGDEVSGLVKPLMVALLKGLLTPILGDSVSYVNAPLLAHQRGIRVSQAKGLKPREYGNLISCQVILEDGEETIISGTLLDRHEPYIVQINQYRIHFVPQGKLLLMGSYDKPGVIGRVGTMMAQNNVNIASWQTGREEPGGQTFTVLALDQTVGQEVLDLLEQQDFVRHVHQVEL
jgi:D-3-phosphoglycerate dehydrogenase / 2-oxoglutarate reductase